MVHSNRSLEWFYWVLVDDKIDKSSLEHILDLQVSKWSMLVSGSTMVTVWHTEKKNQFHEKN